MNVTTLIADTIFSGPTKDPEWTGLVASSDTEKVQVLFKTMQAAGFVSSIILGSQDSVQKMDADKFHRDVEWYAELSAAQRPQAHGVLLLDGGNVLAINLGMGAIFFKLTETAKKELTNQIGRAHV